MEDGLGTLTPALSRRREREQGTTRWGPRDLHPRPRHGGECWSEEAEPADAHPVNLAARVPVASTHLPSRNPV